MKKNRNLEICRVQQLLILTITLKKNKIICACIPDRDQSGSILRTSSFFLFNIDIVHHFNTVNNSDMVEAGHTRALDTCSCYRIRREASVSLIRQSVWSCLQLMHECDIRVFALQCCRVQPVNQLEKLYPLGTPVTRASC